MIDYSAGIALSDVSGTKVPPLEQTLNRLDLNITDLIDAISNLERKLAPVLGPSVPNAPATAATTADQSPVVNRLESFVERIRYAGSHINLIQTQLEV